MRIALWLALIALPVVSPLTARAAGPPRIVVLPIRHAEGVDGDRITLLAERLLVALDDAGLEAVAAGNGVPDADRCSAACIARQAKIGRASQVLAVRLLVEDDVITCFAALYDASGKVIRRTEVGNLKGDDLTKALPAELGAWAAEVEPAAPKPPLIAVVPPADPAGYTIAGPLAAALAGQLAAWDAVSVAVAVGEAAAQSPYVANVTIDGLEVVRRKHHTRHYLDGQLVATFTLTAADGTVVFSKQATARVSVRARKTTREAVLATLVKQTVDQWMASFRGQVGPETLKGQ